LNIVENVLKFYLFKGDTVSPFELPFFYVDGSCSRAENIDIEYCRLLLFGRRGDDGNESTDNRRR